MWRFLGGVASALLFVTAGFFLWKAQADRPPLIPPMPIAGAAAPMGLTDLAGPPSAREKTREEKRFQRYDKDRNGAVGRDEYLFTVRRLLPSWTLTTTVSWGSTNMRSRPWRSLRERTATRTAH